jgi:hypothetical protein
MDKVQKTAFTGGNENVSFRLRTTCVCLGLCSELYIDRARATQLGQRLSRTIHETGILIVAY